MFASGEHIVKKVTDNQLNGEFGETVVKAAILGLGHVFKGRGRLETGIDCSTSRSKQRTN